MSSFIKLLKLSKFIISVFVIRKEIIVLSIIKVIVNIINKKNKEVVNIFIENVNISFEAKEVT